MLVDHPFNTSDPYPTYTGRILLQTSPGIVGS